MLVKRIVQMMVNLLIGRWLLHFSVTARSAPIITGTIAPTAAIAEILLSAPRRGSYGTKRGSWSDAIK